MTWPDGHPDPPPKDPAGAPGNALPPHSSQCMGCGPDNPAGLAMQVRREGDEVVCEQTFDHRQVGAPGLAHGGAVAAACDDLFGFVLYLVAAWCLSQYCLWHLCLNKQLEDHATKLKRESFMLKHDDCDQSALLDLGCPIVLYSSS